LLTGKGGECGGGANQTTTRKPGPSYIISYSLGAEGWGEEPSRNAPFKVVQQITLNRAGSLNLLDPRRVKEEISSLNYIQYVTIVKSNEQDCTTVE
jgi:hypothetical protein